MNGLGGAAKRFIVVGAGESFALQTDGGTRFSRFDASASIR